MPSDGNKLPSEFLLSFQNYLKLKKYFKALKRLYSYFKLKKNKVMMKKLVDFFNSDVGKLNYQINGLQIISDVIENPFRHPKKSSVTHNLHVIQEHLPTKYKSLIEDIF